MKKQYMVLMLSILLGLGFTSCNDWLDVEQKTEKKADDMFDNYSGFQGALAGCYSDLAKTDLYGSRLTYTNLEALANLWYLDINIVQYGSILENCYFRMHDYSQSDVENAIKAIYRTFFNTILEANMVIKGYEEKGDNIGDETAACVVGGEAYAIRALCQFDVLRLFGQIPVNATIQVDLPYSEATEYNDVVYYYPFDEYVAKLQADIEKAKSLLKDNDPICQYTYKELNNVGNTGYEDVDVKDDFLVSRQYRMNYWAVRALEARMYMYLGQKEKAYEIAMDVINAQTANGEKIVELSSLSDYGNEKSSSGDDSNSEPLFSSPSECLFGLYIDELHDRTVPVLLGADKSEVSVRLEENLVLSENWFDDVFKNINTATDIRYLYMWEQTTTSQRVNIYPTIRKYYVEESGVIPILRLSEMYLIAMEGAPTLQEATNLYATYMASKGVNVHDEFTFQSEVEDKLFDEYRIELFAEGQMFYYYKRHNTNKMWSNETVEVSESQYILPLPNTESNPVK